MLYCRLPRYALTVLRFHSFFRYGVAYPTATSVLPPQASAQDSHVQHDHSLQLVPDRCSGPQLLAMQTAILDANLLAGAALNTASDFPRSPSITSSNPTSKLPESSLMMNIVIDHFLCCLDESPVDSNQLFSLQRLAYHTSIRHVIS